MDNDQHVWRSTGICCHTSHLCKRLLCKPTGSASDGDSHQSESGLLHGCWGALENHLRTILNSNCLTETHPSHHVLRVLQGAAGEMQLVGRFVGLEPMAAFLNIYGRMPSCCVILLCNKRVSQDFPHEEMGTQLNTPSLPFVFAWFAILFLSSSYDGQGHHALVTS